MPGRLVALQDGAIEGRNLGKLSRLSIERYYGDARASHVVIWGGDSLEYLQYRAEGFVFLRLRGDVMEGSLRELVDTLRSRFAFWPTTQWWIHVANRSEGVGWLLVDTTKVVEVDRTLE